VQAAVRVVQHSMNDVSFIRVDIQPANLEIYCDAPKVRSALVAIVMNAMEAVPSEREIQLEIQVRTNVEGEQIQIDVKDNGRGFSDEAKVQAFRPFFSTKTAGSGLGADGSQ
jgi:two-component system, NtrC family, C4-dicarboxylate transport sensor histidine kinase DctB